jgi:hypothetical protein|tara:strand:- start:15604 stop:15744 length:141 start_codon:yes stop_codon:yes gene_type:complete
VVAEIIFVCTDGHRIIIERRAELKSSALESERQTACACKNVNCDWF